MYYTELTVANFFSQVISVCTNVYVIKFIKDTFDINQSLYRILWIDAITITLSVFSALLISLSSLVSIPFGPVGCFVLAYLSHSGFYINPLFPFMISFIR